MSWTLQNGRLDFAWSEHGGPPVEEPERKGFGTTLVTSSLAGDGAEIDVDYAPEGMRWRLALPLDTVARQIDAPAPTPHLIPRSAPARTIPQPGLLPGLRVLVVEDEPLLAMELTLEIQEAGAEAIGPASSCTQALDLIRSEHPDIALLDGNLNGERIDAVADELAARDTPFAFVSGYGREHLPEGHTDRPIISKPFVAAEIVAMIARLADCRAASSLDPVA
jgi:CheY-like chemotaxis protein